MKQLAEKELLLLVEGSGSVEFRPPVVRNLVGPSGSDRSVTSAGENLSSLKMFSLKDSMPRFLNPFTAAFIYASLKRRLT